MEGVEDEDVISLDRQRYMERDIRGIRRRLNKIVADHGPPPLVAFDVWTGWWRASERSMKLMVGANTFKEERFKWKFSREGLNKGYKIFHVESFIKSL